jgi:hypothetical protein
MRVVIIHHTPKTNFRDTTEWKPSDWMYSGAGAAVLTNWARAYLVIDPCETHGLYKFIAAKRGKRIGWGDRSRLCQNPLHRLRNYSDETYHKWFYSEKTLTSQRDSRQEAIIALVLLLDSEHRTTRKVLDVMNRATAR